MQPDGHVALRHFLENRQKIGIVQRPPIHIRIELESHRAQFQYRAIHFLYRCGGIVHGQRCHETRKAIRMLHHKFRQAIVGQLRQFRRQLRVSQGLDGRRGHAHHLAVIAETIHDAKAHIEIHHRGNIGRAAS